VSGISFEAVKRDGSLDWRFLLQGIQGVVNCLSYTKWEGIWPVARGLFWQIPDLLARPELTVSGAVLQYVNQFIYEGDLEEYHIQELFRTSSPYIPGTVWETSGPLWHLHQGWFSHDELVVPGRRLEKIDVDAIQREGNHLIKIDTHLRYDFKEPQTDIFGVGDAPGQIDEVFSDMHTRSKRILSALIAEEMAGRIGLNA
jgi:uncharacterized protein (TIGR04255 family)